MSDPHSWYAEGLRFACTRCGGCCVGAGSVRASDDEIDALARHLGLEDVEFRASHTRVLRGGEVSLRKKPGGSCIFYDPERGCRVYAERPRQCRTWPFWRAVVHSRERWDEESAGCPGMNQGPLHPADPITHTAATDGTSGIIPPQSQTPTRRGLTRRGRS